MKRATLLCVVAFAFMFPLFASAHLCNDVFVQAKDNLAVKVDIRDGQLRIAKEASFRVYLLNTMDRDIVCIELNVDCKEFDATVTPSPDWRDHPQLKTIVRGGKKEYFEVTLARKKGVPDGKYKIALTLVNPKNRAQVFKTTDVAESADILALPKATSIKIDGNPASTEWKNALLASDFYDYVPDPKSRGGRYFINARCDDQPRVRLAWDDTNIYLMYGFKSTLKPTADKIVAMLSKTFDDAPVKLEFDRIKGELTASCDAKDIKSSFKVKDGEMECSIPRKLLGIEARDVTGFCANFYRELEYETKDPKGKPTTVKATNYWRGNKHSYTNPVMFARLEFEK